MNEIKLKWNNKNWNWNTVMQFRDMNVYMKSKMKYRAKKHRERRRKKCLATLEIWWTTPIHESNNTKYSSTINAAIASNNENYFNSIHLIRFQLFSRRLICCCCFQIIVTFCVFSVFIRSISFSIIFFLLLFWYIFNGFDEFIAFQ